MTALASVLGLAPAFLARPVRLHAQAMGTFIGNLKFQPVNRDGRVVFELLENYAYLDPKGRMWQAKAGLLTDGATIPSVLWPVIGHPYEGLYLNAAVIHDYYCISDNRYRHWQDVHHVFYDAMLSNGISDTRAKLMFFAVWRFGPRWDISELRPCTPTDTDFCSSVAPVAYRIVNRDVLEYDAAYEANILNILKNESNIDGYRLDDLIDMEADLRSLPRDTRVAEVDAATIEGWYFANPYRIRLVDP